jgi:thioesterase domain-containing protein
MTGEGRLPSTVVEVAADYIAEIRAIQPDGPYHLVGWSFGGMVAHEMALQLQADGQDVALLALLDAFPKDASERADRAFLDERELLLALLDLAGYDSAELRNGPLDRAKVAELLRNQGGVLSGLTEEHLQALHRVFENNSDLARDCVPGNYRGDVLLFTAEVDQTADAGRWAPHVDGDVEVRAVSCRHNDMTQPVPLREIGRVLAQRLA